MFLRSTVRLAGPSTVAVDACLISAWSCSAVFPLSLGSRMSAMRMTRLPMVSHGSLFLALVLVFCCFIPLLLALALQSDWRPNQLDLPPVSCRSLGCLWC